MVWPLTLCLLAATLTVPADDPPAEGFRLRSIPLPSSGRYNQGNSDVIAFSPDGTLVAAGGDRAVYVWDATTGRERTRAHLPVPPGPVHLSFAADGKELAVVGILDPAVRWFDPATGKQVRERAHPEPKRQRSARSFPLVGFGPGGGWLITHDTDGQAGAVEMVDAATGKPSAELEAVGPFGMQGHALTRTGATLVTGSANWVAQVWDTKTGKLRRTVGDPNSWKRRQTLRVVAVSPGGEHFAAAVGLSADRPGPRHLLEVWGVNDGRHYCSLPAPGHVTTAAFAADGRTIAASTSAWDVVLFDLLRDAPAAGYTMPGRAHYHVTSPDGRTLAALGWGLHDTPGATLHLTTFPMLPSPLPDAGDLVGEQVPEWWAALSSANEFRRRYAVRAWLARPEQTTHEAAARVAPEPARRRATVADLIKTLDDDSPDTRDKAQAELLPLAHRFEPLLTAAHRAAGPGEVRNRLTTVLATVRDTPPPADLTADLRAVELLEAVATPAAKALLARLAGGVADSRLTAEAAAAVGRLGKR